MTGKIDSDDDWVVDSDSNEHITHEINILKNKTKNHFENPVLVPNEQTIPVEGEGEYTMSGGTRLIGVLYIPKFTWNLLFVSH